VTAHLRSLAVLAVWLALTASGIAFAQRGGGPGGQQQEGVGVGGSANEGQSAQEKKHKPKAAQVGAGTTNGSTTGMSEPEKKDSGNDEPPLPSAKLCDDYSGDVHKHCLEVVLPAGRAPASGSPPAKQE
jgi:hypothetical protein